MQNLVEISTESYRPLLLRFVAGPQPRLNRSVHAAHRARRKYALLVDETVKVKTEEEFMIQLSAIET